VAAGTVLQAEAMSWKFAGTTPFLRRKAMAVSYSREYQPLRSDIWTMAEALVALHYYG
jgi:hypothetical protein